MKISKYFAVLKPHLIPLIVPVFYYIYSNKAGLFQITKLDCFDTY